MLLSACCCGGCFDNDDCPVAFGLLGDYTYDVAVDTSGILGTFHTAAITDISVMPNVDAQACYASVQVKDFCCAQPPGCDIPSEYTADSYFDQMVMPTVTSQQTNAPCYVMFRRDSQIPGLVIKKRCTANKTVNGKNCDDTYPVSCSDLYPDCYQGPAPNYLTNPITVQSSYAGRVDDSTLCGDHVFQFDRGVNFGGLIVGSGALRFQRNAQTTFTGSQIVGTGLTNLAYRHRTNICNAADTSDCGPCTYNLGNASARCADGRCCCRSVLDITISVERTWNSISYTWNAVTMDFDQVLGFPQTHAQRIRCVYEGPVDPALYGVAGSSATRSFKLLHASISEALGSSFFGHQTRRWVNDYCPNDVFGSAGTSSGPTQLSATTIVDDECDPCVAADPPVPALLTAEQAAALGIPDTVDVVRITPP